MARGPYEVDPFTRITGSLILSWGFQGERSRIPRLDDPKTRFSSKPVEFNALGGGVERKKKRLGSSLNPKFFVTVVGSTHLKNMGKLHDFPKTEGSKFQKCLKVTT